MKKIEIVARSTEQALEKAATRLEMPLDELSILEEYDPDDNDIKVLEKEEEENPEFKIDGEPGLFVVSVSMEKTFAAIREWLEGLVERFQPKSRIELIPHDDAVTAVIHAEDPSIWIGRQGQTLGALQHVVSRVLPQIVENCPMVHLDVGDYREKRLEKLEEMADFALRRAKKSRRSFKMKPMSSQDRKYVHQYLKEKKGVETTSVGREPHRYIVVDLPGNKDRDRNDKRDNNRGKGRGRGRDDERNYDKNNKNKGDKSDENSEKYYYKSDPIEAPKKVSIDELLDKLPEAEDGAESAAPDQENKEFDSSDQKRKDSKQMEDVLDDGLVDELE